MRARRAAGRAFTGACVMGDGRRVRVWWWGIGCVLAEAGRLTEAKAIFLQVQAAVAATAGFYRLPDAWVNLANVHLGLDQYDAAAQGYTNALKRFYELPSSNRPTTKECLFLSTHEPCSLCLSAITWAGFDNFWYLFSHEDSRDEFAIPHDLKILKEVFRLEPGGYNTRNAFWIAHGLRAEINGLPPSDREPLHTRLDAIKAKYASLSGQYQAHKDTNDIPLN